MTPFAYVFPVFFVTLWVTIGHMLAWAGGWHQLARRYVATDGFSGESHGFCSGEMGWTNYNGVLWLGTDGEGLRLAVMFPFRGGHPPLFLPWHEVRLGERKKRFLSGEWVTLHLGSEEDVRLCLPARKADALLPAGLARHSAPTGC
ncbi:MAG: hypothetical protein JWM80_5854 [Cyanobacteria bacterium RYN_339]|nr:hypothetical protein [Cyanobacteria bacterium RYN_339]